jgi:hypothetical protein
MIQHLASSYGPESRNRLDQANDTSADGARAVLESFYYALNRRDADVSAVSGPTTASPS